MQTITSKNTSVNTSKVPYIFNHIDWKAMQVIFPRMTVIDFGCGRKIDHIAQFIMEQGKDISYIGYDPYWGPITDLKDVTKLVNRYLNQQILPVFMLSNVLNVIPDLDQMWEIKRYIQQFTVPYFVKIYEGNKSGVGGMSRPDCWQWNQPTKYYLEGDKYEIMKKQIITHRLYEQFIK